MDAAEWERLGLYDPAEPGAAYQLELLEFLVDRGATVEDLLEYRDGLPGLTAVLALRGGRALTLPEVVAESQLDEAQVAAIVRAAGLPSQGQRTASSSKASPGWAGAWPRPRTSSGATPCCSSSASWVPP